MITGTNYNQVEPKEEGSFPKPTPGGYIIKIVKVENNPKKQYLKISFDFAEGEFAGHYRELFEKFKFWGGSFIRSYKESAQGFFAGFLEAVKKSNDGAPGLINEAGEVDETKLVGLKIGAVLGNEQYEANDGTIKMALRVFQIRSIKAIQDGDYTIPQDKLLESHNATNTVVDTTAETPDNFEQIDAEVPF